MKLFMWFALDEETRFIIMLAVARLSSVILGYEYQRSKIDILSEQQNHRCCYCGVRFVDRPPGFSPKKRHWRSLPKYIDHPDLATIEHVVRLCEQGERIWDNEVAACRRCNSSRGDHDAEFFYENREAILRDTRKQRLEARRKRRYRVKSYLVATGQKNEPRIRAPQYGRIGKRKPIASMQDIWPTDQRGWGNTPPPPNTQDNSANTT